ncbi:MAG: sensor histidine kinase, partial [Acetanaerobacterium sp.]
FEAMYDIDESCSGCPVLKLVLQPLVENSLYHGIRAKGENGIIHISVRRSPLGVELSVSDNGVGMSEEKINSLLRRDADKSQDSFGLWGTLERIRIFYGRESCFRIESTSGIGTKVTLIIPGEADNI